MGMFQIGRVLGQNKHEYVEPKVALHNVHANYKLTCLFKQLAYKAARKIRSLLLAYAMSADHMELMLPHKALSKSMTIAVIQKASRLLGMSAAAPFSTFELTSLVKAPALETL